MKIRGIHIDSKKHGYCCDSCNAVVKKLMYVYELPGVIVCRCSNCGYYVSVVKGVDSNGTVGEEKKKRP